MSLRSDSRREFNTVSSGPTHQEAVTTAAARLEKAYQSFSVSELKWDYSCNISAWSRALILKELARRRIPMLHFLAVKGKRRGGAK